MGFQGGRPKGAVARVPGHPVTTSASTWEQADKAYQAHHVTCAHCKAAGIRITERQRCPEGQALWQDYEQAGLPPHFTWLHQRQRKK